LENKGIRHFSALANAGETPLCKFQRRGAFIVPLIIEKNTVMMQKVQCARWYRVVFDSHSRKDVRNSLKISAPHPLMKIYQLIPLSAKYMSMDSIFEGQNHKNFVHIVEASIKIKVE
jgi:hypothetical protein